MGNPFTYITGFFKWLGLFQSREVAAKTAQLQLAEQQHRGEIFALTTTQEQQIRDLTAQFEERLRVLETQRDDFKSQVAAKDTDITDTRKREQEARDEIGRIHSELDLFRQQASKDRVDRRAEELLVTIAERKEGWTQPKLFSYCFGHKIAEAEYFFGQLVRVGYVEKIGVDASGVDLWGVTEKGRPLAFSRCR
jgi:hypothetical protein